MRAHFRTSVPVHRRSTSELATIIGETVSQTEAPTITPFAHVFTDNRGSIYEASHDLSDGSCCRIGRITNLPENDGNTRRGDHYHPGDETFVIIQGSVTLYTAPVDDRTNITIRHLKAGDTINIVAFTIHTFLCAPGSVLNSIANQPFSDDWIVKAKLDLSQLPT